MIVVLVDIYVDPSRLDEFQGPMTEIAQKCAKEPQCSMFNVYRDEKEPGRHTIVEHWDMTPEQFMTVSLATSKSLCERESYGRLTSTGANEQAVLQAVRRGYEVNVDEGARDQNDDSVASGDFDKWSALCECLRQTETACANLEKKQANRLKSEWIFILSSLVLARPCCHSLAGL